MEVKSTRELEETLSRLNHPELAAAALQHLDARLRDISSLETIEAQVYADAPDLFGEGRDESVRMEMQRLGWLVSVKERVPRTYWEDEEGYKADEILR